MLEVMAKYWEELGRKREDATETESEIEDVGGHELNMCEEVSWEEVVEVMKCMKRGKAAGPDGIMNEMLMYGKGRLVEMMLQMMNVVMKSECCPLDWERSLLVSLHKDGDVEQVSNYRGIVLGCNVVKFFCAEKREKKNSYVFPGYGKAYDSVWKERLWHRMRQGTGM